MKNHNFSSLVMVAVGLFQKGHPNKNGEMPIIFTPIAGKIPLKCRVLDGTIAKNLGIEPNNLYLLSIIEGEPNLYGRTFQFTNCGKPLIDDIGKAPKTFGVPQILDLDDDVEENDDDEEIPEPLPQVIVPTRNNPVVKTGTVAKPGRKR